MRELRHCTYLQTNAEDKNYEKDDQNVEYRIFICRLAQFFRTSPSWSEEDKHEGKAGFFKKADTNGDGILDDAEKAAAKQKHDEHFQKMLAEHPELKTKLDANKDGQIDADERKAGRQHLREHREGKHKEFLEKHPELKGKLDTDSNGSVSKEEWKAGKEARSELNQEKSKQFFEKHPHAKEKMDTNQDGAVDKTERWAAREQRHKKHSAS